MNKTPDTSAEEAEGTPAYLLEPFVTEDGISVPPPTRPMGPRRLTRYYEEVAEYLRAIERGDEELPEEPMFMGEVEGLDRNSDRLQSLASLSHMGSINADGKDQVTVDYDESSSTVVEDPLGHIGQQVMAADSNTSPTPATLETQNLAAATDEIVGTSDFVSAEDWVAHEETAAEPEAEEQTSDSEEGELVESEQAESQEQASLQVPALPLPEPIAAVEAQGLDLSEIDQQQAAQVQADVTESAPEDLASPPAHTVESESSEETDGAEESAAREGEQASKFNFAGSIKRTGEATSQDLEVLEKEAESAPAPADQKSKTPGLIIALAGLLLLALILAGLWFYFLG